MVRTTTPDTSYFRELTLRTREDWTRFWFTPADPTTLGSIRIATGLMLLYVHGVYTLDLAALVGPGGWVRPEVVGPSARAPFDPTYLTLLGEGWPLYLAHGLGLAVLALFTLGLFTRVISILAFGVVLAYINRNGAMLFGLDQITSMLCLYLAIGPSGSALSLDRLVARSRNWRRQLGFRSRSEPPPEDRRSVGANLAIRLIQVHMCLIYLCAGLAKRGDAWWDGTAIWRVLATYEFQIFDPRWFADYPGVLALAGYVTVLWELSFCVLIWNRLLRPLVLVVAVLLHAGIGLFMGLPTFGVLMLVGCASFVEPAFLKRLYSRMFAGPGRLRLVYDGLCPLCMRAASVIKAVDPWDQVQLVDFNTVKPSSVHRRLDFDTCMQAMQLVTAGGRLYAGFYAFRALSCRLRILWPLAAFLFLPGVATVGVGVYSFIAARRPRFLDCPEGTCARHGSEAESPRSAPRSSGKTQKS